MLFPGEFCRTSGVYKVVHYQHRMPHHVAINEAQPFPVCRRCQSKVRYFPTKAKTQEQSAIGTIPEDPDLGERFFTN
jgi:hypothetical protein